MGSHSAMKGVAAIGRDVLSCSNFSRHDYHLIEAIDFGEVLGG